MTGKQSTYAAGILMLLSVAACHNSHTVTAKRIPHQAEIKRPGALLYIDEIDHKQVLSNESKESNKHFVAYKVGFYDSTLLMDKPKQEAAALYYQYKMSYDWKMLLEGDSIAPVFYHPVTSLNRQVSEGVLVFELPENKQADTLVYIDATGAWDTRIITLKATK